MLVEQLALTYKCHSAIGNSLDLKEMLKEVLKTFLNETFALYGAFYLYDDEKKNLNKIISMGKVKDFDIEDYSMVYESFNISENKNNDNQRVLILPLDKGVLAFIFSKKNMDMNFLGSMFQGLALKLNISIDSCLNVMIMKKRNERLKTLALELEKQRKDLVEANRYKNDFLANMSHELKTPLNSIIVISSVMQKNKKGKLDEEQVKNMNIINTCGNDLLLLINDILDISKIEAGETSLNLKKVDIIQILNHLYDSMLPLAKEKNLIFEKDINLDNSIILSDESRLKQIIKNLLSNAFKFTKEGKVQILVKEKPENIEISIIDDGIGIGKDKLEHIFDRFKQADGSTTRSYGGTGLGLAISKELSHLLGGDIKVSSEVGIGSDFKLFLPKKAIIKQISDEKVDISSGNDNFKSDEIIFFDDFTSANEEEVENCFENLLIVNADHIYLFALSVALKKEGVTLEHIDDIQSAIKLVNSKRFDAIMIDKEDENEDYTKLIKKAKNQGLFIILVSNEKNKNVNLNIKKEEINSSFSDTIIKEVKKFKG